MGGLNPIFFDFLIFFNFAKPLSQCQTYLGNHNEKPSYLKDLMMLASMTISDTVIYLRYNSPLICLSQLAYYRSQFLLDRLGSCLKLFVSTEGPSYHEFASQFGLTIFFT